MLKEIQKEVENLRIKVYSGESLEDTEKEEDKQLINTMDRINKGVGLDKCLHCGLNRTPEGHDGCIGTLENVMNACCGHGRPKEAYIQFNHENYKKDPNKIRIGGSEAIDYIKSNSTP